MCVRSLSRMHCRLPRCLGSMWFWWLVASHRLNVSTDVRLKLRWCHFVCAHRQTVFSSCGKWHRRILSRRKCLQLHFSVRSSVRVWFRRWLLARGEWATRNRYFVCLSMFGMCGCFHFLHLLPWMVCVCTATIRRECRPLEGIRRILRTLSMLCRSNGIYFLLPTNPFPCTIAPSICTHTREWCEILSHDSVLVWLLRYTMHRHPPSLKHTHTHADRTRRDSEVICTKWYYEFIMTETVAGFQSICRGKRARARAMPLFEWRNILIDILIKRSKLISAKFSDFFCHFDDDDDDKKEEEDGDDDDGGDSSRQNSCGSNVGHIFGR